MSSTRTFRVPLVWSTFAAATAVWAASFTLLAQQPGPSGSAAPAPPPGGGVQTNPQGAGGRGAFGGRGRGNDGADFTPKSPYMPRTPAEEAKGFILPNGYRMELVVSDPDIISPSVVEFDGNGRMYVGEMISYMMDADATREHDPISRISRWESTKNDGHFDKHTVFVDHLVAPRAILPLEDGVILTTETDSDDVVKWTDTNGDGVADKREIFFTGIGQSGDPNIEHQKAGLMWNLDNWIYTTYNAFRIRWTPNGVVREPTGSNGGQWGLSHDDEGNLWFVDAGGERGPVNFQFPIHYGAFTPCQPAGGRGGRGAFGPGAGAPGAAPDAAPPAVDPTCPTAFEKDFEVVWPAPGIGDMQGGMFRTRMPSQNLNHFTAATGPSIVRGDRVPDDLKGDLLFTEPVGRLIRRAKVVKIKGLTQLRNAYPGSEFLTSTDQLFRPVNIQTGPDGSEYVSDLYHGIIQEYQWSGPGSYLRAKIEQYQLDKVVSLGRVWRLRYDGRAAVPATPTNPGQSAIPAIALDLNQPKLYSETPAQWVTRLSHPNGFWRDMAQRLLVLKQDKSVVPGLQQMTRTSPNLVARFHALWTLEGLGALDASLVREEMKDPSPRMRVQAIRASETLYTAGDKSLDADYRALTKDSNADVAIQAMLTLSLFKAADLSDVVKATQAEIKARGVKEVGDRLLAPSANAAFGGGRGAGATLTPEEQDLMQQGGQIFNELCFSCHGDDGRGRPLAGAPPGTNMAPPLAGSPRVNGHRDYIIKALLNGVTGPVGDKTYTEVMIPMGSNKDEWIAAVASYVRTSFGNSGGFVTAADVARVRAASASRKTPWTVADLEASLPKLLEPQPTWRLSASQGSDTAVNALTLRTWSSNVPQKAGMWFQIELPQPAMITEIQFDSRTGRGGGAGGGGGRRGAPVGAEGAAPATAIAASGAPAQVPPPTFPTGARGSGASPANASAAAPVNAQGPPAPAAQGASAAAPAAQAGLGAGGRGAPGGPAPVSGYPRAYRVQVSMDGTSWGQPVAEGQGTSGRMNIAFKPVQAKFIRITQTDTADDSPSWSMADLKIYARN